MALPPLFMHYKKVAALIRRHLNAKRRHHIKEQRRDAYPKQRSPRRCPRHDSDEDYDL